jgi:type IV pilus assembly protein PilW
MTIHVRAGHPGLARCTASGHSLTEVMVALVLGLLVIVGTVTVYVKARETYAATEAESRLQENARYALGIIAADVRMANFWGLHNRADLVTANTSSTFPATCGATWVTDIGHFVAGYNNGYAASCAPSGGGAAAGTDVLIIRRASSQRISPQSATVATASRDQVLIVSSRTAGEIFVPRQTANTLPAGYAVSDPAGQPPLADTRQLLVNAYYVSRNSSAATGYPALRRKTLVSGPAIGEEEVLPGIEDLQFQVGVDTTGDANADLYANPDALPANGTPVSVRIWLRLRAQERDASFADNAVYAYADQSFTAPGDHHRRLLVSQTIQLRNAPP